MTMASNQLLIKKGMPEFMRVTRELGVQINPDQEVWPDLYDIITRADVALHSVQEVMEFLLVQALMALQPPQPGTLADHVILEAFRIKWIPRPKEGTATECTRGIWEAHLCGDATSQPKVPLRLECVSQDVAMFGDEPPRLAHTCGILFNSKVKLKTSPEIANARQVIDLRYVFQSPRRAAVFFADAMDFLSEWLVTNEIQVPGSDRITTDVKFFRSDSDKVRKHMLKTNPKSARSTALHDLVYCIWLEDNVVSKTCIQSSIPFERIKEGEVFKWFVVAACRVRSWARNFPMRFSPDDLSENLRMFYDRLVQARIELPDWTVNEPNMRKASEGVREIDQKVYAADRSRTLCIENGLEPVVSTTKANGTAQSSREEEVAAESLLVLRSCKICGVERSRACYSKKIWKKCRESNDYEPICNECRSDEASPGAASVDSALSEPSVPEAVQGVSDSATECSPCGYVCDIEDIECGICFYMFGKKHQKVTRPCCRQLICFKCDARCARLDRGCPFCRNACGRAVGKKRHS